MITRELREAARTLDIVDPKRVDLWHQGKTVLGFLVGQTMKRDPTLSIPALNAAFGELLGPWGRREANTALLAEIRQVDR